MNMQNTENFFKILDLKEGTRGAYVRVEVNILINIY